MEVSLTYRTLKKKTWKELNGNANFCNLFYFYFLNVLRWLENLLLHHYFFKASLVGEIIFSCIIDLGIKFPLQPKNMGKVEGEEGIWM